MKKLREFSVFLLALAALLLFSSCSSAGDISDREQHQAEASGLTLHKIGVPTYNLSDAQVKMFREYLENYIKGCFDDVTFLYSDSITNEEELMAFLSACADEGVEGIMAFTSYDLKTEVDFCAEKEMYYIRPAGTNEETAFASVADNPYFLGEIGPGAQLEYQAGADMTRALAHPEDGHSYVILSGGACMGNEMHRLRTLGILETLQEVYGAAFDRTPEELACVKEKTVLAAGGLNVAICPGYVEIPAYGEAASETIASGNYDIVLSSVPVTSLMDALKAVDIRCGVIDCFSEDNYFGFHKGKIAYVAGKYQSEVGPGFAALYNAITGNADLYRENGKAFRLEQGFWTASDEATYNKMYGMSSGISLNAYNYEDLYSVVKLLNPDSSFADFQSLVEAYHYEDCLARRGGQ